MKPFRIYISNIRKYCTNYSSSRKSNLRISIFDKAEIWLSNLVGSESSITVSSGYMAGQLVRHTMHCKEHKLFYAPHTHPALYSSSPSKVLFSTYLSFSALNSDIRNHLQSKQGTIPVVFLDAIDFSGSNYPDFEGLRMLPLEEIILVVDDSHGIGIVGKNGGGVFGILKDLNPKELVVCCSLGKGFGIQAGAIFGSKQRMEQFVNTPFFGGASPAAPAGMASLIEAETIYIKKRKKLKNNMEFFMAYNKAISKFKYMPQHPTFSYTDVNLSKYLLQHGVLATCFPYPDENFPLMSRIVISAHHKTEDIRFICNLINSYNEVV